MNKKNTITLKLTPAQRNLLLEIQNMIIEPELSRRVGVAVQQGNKYEIQLSLDELEDLCGYVSAEANHTKDEKLYNRLCQLCDYFEDIIDKNGGASFEDDFEEEIENNSSQTGGVYVFKVALEGDKKIWRRIAIRGGQTLHDLHDVIYTAFDRDDEHLYSFYLAPKSVTTSNRRKLIKAATEYTCPYNTESPFGMDEDSESAAKAKIESLMLSVDRKLFYLFDFGDNWWHELTVEQVDSKADADKYPRIIEKHGDSPPQYPEWDDQDEEFLEKNP